MKWILVVVSWLLAACVAARSTAFFAGMLAVDLNRSNSRPITSVNVPVITINEGQTTAVAAASKYEPLAVSGTKTLGYHTLRTQGPFTRSLRVEVTTQNFFSYKLQTIQPSEFSTFFRSSRTKWGRIITLQPSTDSIALESTKVMGTVTLPAASYRSFSTITGSTDIIRSNSGNSVSPKSSLPSSSASIIDKPDSGSTLTLRTETPRKPSSSSSSSSSLTLRTETPRKPSSSSPSSITTRTDDRSAQFSLLTSLTVWPLSLTSTPTTPFTVFSPSLITETYKTTDSKDHHVKWATSTKITLIVVTSTPVHLRHRSSTISSRTTQQTRGPPGLNQLNTANTLTNPTSLLLTILISLLL